MTNRVVLVIIAGLLALIWLELGGQDRLDRLARSAAALVSIRGNAEEPAPPPPGASQPPGGVWGWRDDPLPAK